MQLMIVACCWSRGCFFFFFKEVSLKNVNLHPGILEFLIQSFHGHEHKNIKLSVEEFKLRFRLQFTIYQLSVIHSTIT